MGRRVTGFAGDRQTAWSRPVRKALVDLFGLPADVASAGDGDVPDTMMGAP